jgi:hypothetical protein
MDVVLDGLMRRYECGAVVEEPLRPRDATWLKLPEDLAICRARRESQEPRRSSGAFSRITGISGGIFSVPLPASRTRSAGICPELRLTCCRLLKRLLMIGRQVFRTIPFELRSS